jgi:hypothetical protein
VALAQYDDCIENHRYMIRELFEDRRLFRCRRPGGHFVFSLRSRVRPISKEETEDSLLIAEVGSWYVFGGDWGQSNGDVEKPSFSVSPEFLRLGPLSANSRSVAS